MKSVLQKPVQELLDRKRKAMLLGLGLVVLGLVAGGFYVTHPPKPWLVRWQVSRYLKSHARPNNFKVDFPFPSKAQLAQATGAHAPAKGPRTGKDFDALRTEYLTKKLAAVTLERQILESEAELRQKKPELEALSAQVTAVQATGSATNLNALRSSLNALRKRVGALEKKVAARSDLRAQEAALEPVLSDLWVFQRAWAAEASSAGLSENQDLAGAARKLVANLKPKLDGATSYADIYAVIGQELWVAQRLLKSPSPEYRRTGLTLVLEAGRQALDKAGNTWLAARICQGYVWPHLDLADLKNRRSPFYLQNLINACVQVFRQNDELDNMIRSYRLFLARADTPQGADWARVQLATVHEQLGEVKDALRYLRQVESTNDYRWVLRRIPQLERQL